MERLDLKPKEYILTTVHRAENTNDPERLKAIFEGLSEVSGEIPVILPLHPRTHKVMERMRMSEKINRNLRLIDPVGYLDMVMLEKNARLIATDSGGVQKEAFFYRVPCITLRDETEWVELVELGWNHLVTPDNSSNIAKTIFLNLDSCGIEGNPYGEGRTAEVIVQTLFNQNNI